MLGGGKGILFRMWKKRYEAWLECDQRSNIVCGLLSIDHPKTDRNVRGNGILFGMGKRCYEA